MSDDDLFSDDYFADEEPQANPISDGNTINVLIVDDDTEVHSVTKMALRNFEFEGRGIEFIHAYSGQEAKEKLTSITDINVILLDVVMETEHAGLEVARWIREELRNDFVRIILRTGQPGQAPERQVIREYDINDYKAKTELTSQKLYTLMYTALRSYQHLMILERNKLGMERVIEATKNIIGTVGLQEFLQATLEQLINLIDVRDSIVITTESHAIAADDLPIKVLCSTGVMVQLPPYQKLGELPFHDMAYRALEERKPVFKDGEVLLYCENQFHIAMFYVANIGGLSDLDRHLLQIFSENIGIALENTALNEQIKFNQREVIYRLGEVVESRSKETGNHVKRVAKYSELLARLYGLDQEQCNVIMLASPLHDIGKVGIPDAILHKPGKLNTDEWAVMQTHALVGQKMLEGSNQTLLDTGASIAGTHHERWDGSGYPNGLKGEDIPIEGRITALADIFDALGSVRCYKPAWPHEQVVKLLIEERGKTFDPQLVDIMLDNMEDFLQIQAQYSDKV